MNPDRLVRNRPWLYHLTDSANLAGIREEWRLRSAESLLAQWGLEHQVRERRRSHLFLGDDGRGVKLRDQAPLHRGNISLCGRATYADIVELINRHVFFWPGKADGPSAYGRRHFARYQHEAPAMLRIRSEHLIATYGDNVRVCAYNSGAPRCVAGRGSPRGPDTFVPLGAFERGISGVVEVVVENEVMLPELVECGYQPDGPYERFQR